MSSMFPTLAHNKGKRRCFSLDPVKDDSSKHTEIVIKFGLHKLLSNIIPPAKALDCRVHPRPRMNANKYIRLIFYWTEMTRKALLYLLKFVGLLSQLKRN